MRASTTTSSPTSVALTTTHILSTCLSLLRLSRLHRPRNRTNHKALRRLSIHNHSHSLLNIRLHTNNMQDNRLRPHTLYRLPQRGSDSVPVALHRPTRLAPSMHLPPIFPARAVTATPTNKTPLRNRNTRQTTSLHLRRHPSTHHSPTHHSKWHGNLPQPLPRLRYSVRSSRALVHHSQTAR